MRELKQGPFQLRKIRQFQFTQLKFVNWRSIGKFQNKSFKFELISTKTPNFGALSSFQLST